MVACMSWTLNLSLPTGEKPNSSVWPDRRAALDAASGHEHRVRIDVMIAAKASLRTKFAHRGTAEFPAPDDECPVEQASLTEVLDQRSNRLIDFLAYTFEWLRNVVVMIPVGVIELDEAHTTFDETPRQKTVVRKAALAWFGSIHGQRFFGFFTEIDQFGSAGLHTISHLVGFDARLDLGIAGRFRLQAVEVLNQVECLPLLLSTHAAAVLRG